ncbi:MAG: MarR family transcriptional regulator [Deltaproteobacteria bacterium RBG_13_43_22]|nr:MAG: MarR family transcriptional regulator [Deltaproteobacteria bacterium RBG_13_43_22]
MKNTIQYGKKIDTALSMWVKLMRAYATFQRKNAEHLKNFGITAAQYAVIECLGHQGPLLMGELCRKMLVSGGNMTVVVDNLEKEGLVERVPSNDDRRAIMVRFTPKGKKIFDESFSKHAGYLTQLAAVLTEEEQQDLGRLLKKLGCTLREEP